MNKPTDLPNDTPPHTGPEPTSNLIGVLGSLGGDLKNPRWIYLKGFLFLLSGLLAAGLLLIEHPTWKDAALIGMTVWCFCRFYYFAFYVIEHYVDGNFKFAGLGSFVRYLVTRRPAGK